MNIKLLFLLFPVYLFSQAPAVQWMHTRGGSASDFANGVVQTSDGGYLTAGGTTSNDGDVSGNHGGEGSRDMWLLKFDADGNYEWQQTYGGTYSDWANSIINTTDGGYAAAGCAMSSDDDVAGNQYSGFWIVKLNADGTISWQKSFGSVLGQAQAQQLIQSADGGYVLAGLTPANGGDVTGYHGSYDFWVIKLDSTGNLLWQKALGGSVDDQALTVQQTPDGGYITAGWTNSNDGDVTGFEGCYDGWLVKLSAEGEIEWGQTIGGSGCEHITDIKVTPDGGYVYLGIQGYDSVVVKTDALGNMLWQHQIGGSAQDELDSISLTADGGYAASGFTHSVDGDLAGVPGEGKAWFVRLDAGGEILWQKKLGVSYFDIGSEIKEIAEGEYIVCGFIQTDDLSQNDMFIAKLVPEDLSTRDLRVSTVSIWPNPASSSVTINLPDGAELTNVTISDSEGRIVAVSSYSVVNVSAFAVGVYYINAIVEGSVFNGKFIKQ